MSFFDTKTQLYLQFPPLPPEYTRLLTLENPDNPKIKPMMEETRKIMEKLEGMFLEYKTKCELPGPNYQKNFKSHLGEKIEFRFLFLKLEKYIHKHIEMTREISARVSTTISLLVFCFRILTEKSMPARFDFEGLNQLIQNDFRKNKKYQYYSKRVKSIQVYLTAKQSRNRFPKIASDVLCSELSNSLKGIDQSCKYFPINKFDSILIDHYSSLEIESIIDPVSLEFCTVQASTPKYKKCFRSNVNLEGFNELINVFNATFNVIDDEKILSHKCSLYRLVFDRLYLIDKTIDKSSTNFLRNSHIIRNLSPRDMKMNNIFFDLDDFDKPFVQIFAEKRDMLTISDNLSYIPFFNCPQDIAYKVCVVSRQIDDYATKKSKTIEPISLSFDDFFSTFIVVLSINPPPNADGMCEHIDYFRDVEMCSSMKHAATSLSAAIKYINSFLDEPMADELSQKVGSICRSLTI